MSSCLPCWAPHPGLWGTMTSAASTDVTPAYRTSITPTAPTPLMMWAAMNPGTDDRDFGPTFVNPAAAASV